LSFFFIYMTHMNYCWTSSNSSSDSESITKCVFTTLFE
jgi:hypothetical protein